MVNKVKRTYIIGFTLILIISSCISSSDKDLSLAPEEYSDLGIPDHNRVWDYEDYMSACTALNNIKAADPYSLPRKGSKKSGKYFDRMINPENLSFLFDENISLNERAYQIQKYIDIQGCLITAYTELNPSEQYYNHELIDLYIFGLTIAQDMLDLGQLINESVDEEDIKMQSRYRSIQFLYLKMILLVFHNQQKFYLFEEEDLERLSDFLYNSLLINREWIEDPATQDLKQQIQKVIDSTSSEKIKKKYSTLMKML